MSGHGYPSSDRQTLPAITLMEGDGDGAGKVTATLGTMVGVRQYVHVLMSDRDGDVAVIVLDRGQVGELGAWLIRAAHEIGATW